jgi:hypothetical protein
LSSPRPDLAQYAEFNEVLELGDKQWVVAVCLNPANQQPGAPPANQLTVAKGCSQIKEQKNTPSY